MLRFTSLSLDKDVGSALGAEEKVSGRKARAKVGNSILINSKVMKLWAGY